MDEKQLTDEELAAYEAAAVQSNVRQKIDNNAGDPLAILGTTADAAAIATLGFAALTVALASSSDYAKFKAEFLGALGELAGDHDVIAVSKSFLKKIKDGDVLIPALIKQLPDVIADIERRSTAVSQALIAAKSG